MFPVEPPVIEVVPTAMLEAAAVMTPQPKPVPVVHWMAFAGPVQPGMARATGEPAPAAPTMVLALWLARLGRPTNPVAVKEVVMVGDAIVGDVPKTAAPVPVSSERTPANCAEVVDANCESGCPTTPQVAQA